MVDSLDDGFSAGEGISFKYVVAYDQQGGYASEAVKDFVMWLCYCAIRIFHSSIICFAFVIRHSGKSFPGFRKKARICRSLPSRKRTLKEDQSLEALRISP